MYSVSSNYQSLSLSSWITKSTLEFIYWTHLFLRGLNWGPPQLKNNSSWKLRTSSMQWCFKGLTKGLAARIFSLVQFPLCTKPTLEFVLLPFCTKPTLVWWEGTGWTWPWVLLSSSEWLRRRGLEGNLYVENRREDWG